MMSGSDVRAPDIGAIVRVARRLLWRSGIPSIPVEQRLRTIAHPIAADGDESRVTARKFTT